MWRWMGGCWWESGGEESAYEVVAEGCRERESKSNQAGAIRQKRVQAACLPLTPEARLFALQLKSLTITMPHV